VINRIGKKEVVICTFVATSVLFFIVMGLMTPLIDGHDGSEILKLQLSFKKTNGLKIVRGWGSDGIANFKELMVFDCLYAAAYASFLSSLISFIIVKKGIEKKPVYVVPVYISIMSGVFDCLENTMEIFFVSHPSGFPDRLFFIHSVIACLKWGAVFFAVISIINLSLKKNKSPQ
jgi:hypothetical protein